MGLANAADALTALRVTVEEKALLSWEEVHRALLDGFEGHARVRQALLDAPKYGNDEPAGDGAAVRLRDIYVAAACDATSPGERFSIMAGFYSWNVHAWMADMPASPDGRERGTSLAHGANPMAGQARRGLSALARSVAAIQPGTGASAPLHLEIEARLAQGERGRAAFDALVRGYFALGGVQLIANFVSRGTLEDAIAHPERHRDLTVRVTGYSASFVNLDKSLYAEILSRFD